MATPFKMKGFPAQAGVSPMKKDVSLTTSKGFGDKYKDTKTTTDRKGRVRKTEETFGSTSDFQKDIEKYKEDAHNTLGKNSLDPSTEEGKKVKQGIEDRRSEAVKRGENTGGNVERTRKTKYRKSGKKKKTVEVRDNKTAKYKYDKEGELKKSKYTTTDKGGNKTISKHKKGKTVTRVNKKGFQISDIWGGKKVKNAEKPVASFGHDDGKPTYLHNDPRFKKMNRNSDGTKKK